MGRRCIAGGCSRTTKDNVSLHVFPKDPTTCRKWKNFVEMKRKNCHFSESSVLCSIHFAASEYEPGSLGMAKAGWTKHRMLKSGALPSIHPQKAEKHALDTVPASTPAKRKKSRATEKLALNRMLTDSLVQAAPPAATPEVTASESVLCDDEVMDTSEECSSSLNCEKDTASTTNQSASIGIQVSPPPSKHKKCQTAYKTRSIGLQTLIATKNAETQCNLMEPAVPLSVSTPIKQATGYCIQQNLCGVSDIESSEDEEIMNQDSDSEYCPGEESIQQAEEELCQSSIIQAEPTGSAERECMAKEEKFIVFKSKLLELFQTCPRCESEAKANVSGGGQLTGTMITVTQVCPEEKCPYKRTWSSQPFLGPTRLPAGNLLLSAAVLFTGSQFSKVEALFSAMGVRCISRSTFSSHQATYVEPTILTFWEKTQQSYFSSLKELDGDLIIAGDGRSDSPGHCAKFGSYTTLEMRIGKVIDVPLVQSNEVKNSSWMELEGLSRSVEKLKAQGLVVGTLVTDRHRSIAKWIRENLHDTKHYYDVWHIAKALRKKLDPLALQSDCGDLKGWKRSILNHLYWCASSTPDGDGAVMSAKWQSLLYHLTDVHQGFDTPEFTTCSHGDLTGEARHKKWMKEGSPAYERLAAVAMNKSLVKDIGKLSPIQQTSSVEGYHSVIINFAPKHTAFSYLGMQCRLIMAALHYNENSGRKRVTRPDGSKVTTVYFPKVKKGEPSVRWEKEKSTRGNMTKSIGFLDRVNLRSHA